MRVTVNGQVRELADGATVADVVTAVCASQRGVAVAVDGEVVPRSRWASAPLGPGARVEVVTAAAGG